MVQSTTSRRGYSLNEANASLPLVRAIIEDLRDLTKEIEARETRVETMLAKQGDRRHEIYDDELRESQRSLVEDRQQLARYEQELRHLGVRLRSGATGAVEFPSWLGETPVALHWNLGDDQVHFWSRSDASDEVELWPIKNQPFTSEPTTDTTFGRR